MSPPRRARSCGRQFFLTSRLESPEWGALRALHLLADRVAQGGRGKEGGFTRRGPARKTGAPREGPCRRARASRARGSPRGFSRRRSGQSARSPEPTAGGPGARQPRPARGYVGKPAERRIETETKAPDPQRDLKLAPERAAATVGFAPRSAAPSARSRAVPAPLPACPPAPCPPPPCRLPPRRLGAPPAAPLLQRTAACPSTWETLSPF